MPPINSPAATVGIIAASVTIAAAIAIYESPELQRIGRDLRRRIAIALHNFGDRLSPEERENLFNRPEDAEGFLASRGIVLPDVDADPESLRRQREELMYWNAIRESNKEQEKQQTPEQKHERSPTSRSFDDFLQPFKEARDALVIQTSHEPENRLGMTMTQRRRGAASRGLNHSTYTNPFADEFGISIDEDIDFENSLQEPEKDESGSDIYSATDRGTGEHEQQQHQPISAVISPSQQGSTPNPLPLYTPDIEAVLEPVMAELELAPAQLVSTPLCAYPAPSEPSETEYMTAGQEPDPLSTSFLEVSEEAYNNIQAWALRASNTSGFYSPLPASTAPSSSPSYEPAELVSDNGSSGNSTPIDSASVVDIDAEEGNVTDVGVISDDESLGTGVMTPTSWTEVGSLDSESETGRALFA